MKKFWLLLSVLIISTSFLSIFDVAQSQSMSNLAVPEFTVKLVNRFYDVPPTQTTDPYTGKTTTQPGHQVEYQEIEITIKNQNYPLGIMYNVRTKGHFAQQWREEYNINNKQHPPQSEGQYTVLSIPIENNWPDDAQIDFQVEAMSGAFTSDPDPEHSTSGFRPPTVFDGTTSGWSKTQTLTINKNSNETPDQSTDNSGISSDQNPQTGVSLIELSIIASVVTIIAVTVTYLYIKKQPNKKMISK